MAENSKIEWTDHTFNGWWGCMKVSEGCQHCYAETFSKRVGRNIWGPAATTERWRTKGPWRDILKWDKRAKADGVRRKVFCQSMSDFFEDHPQLVSWRNEATEILEQLEWLDVQLLTKRPENIARMTPAFWTRYQWPAHVWIGTSVENQEAADKRIPELLKVPAAIRFLSCEPLLGPVDISTIGSFGLGQCLECAGAGETSGHYGRSDGIDWCASCLGKGEDPDAVVSWVIVGGESGHHARPMQIEWAQSLSEQCRAAGVAFFMKQLGGAIDKRHDITAFPPDLQVREFPIC